MDFRAASDLPRLRKLAGDWYDENLRGTTAKMVDGTKVEFGQRGRNKATSKGDVLLRAIPAIKAIIESGGVVLREPGNKPHIIQRIVIAAPVSFDGKTLHLAVSVHETADGNWHYDFTLDMDEGAGAPERSHGNDAKASTSPWMGSASDLNLFPWNDEIKTGTTGGFTAANLKDHLVRGADGPLIEKMIASGKIKLHDDATTLPLDDFPNGKIRGVTMPNGDIHLVAANLTPETARAVLLHEVFHSGAEPLIGSQQWRILMERVQTAVDRAMERDDETGFWREAIRQAEDADNPTAEEIAAYAIENREAAPAGLREVVDNIVGAVKAWALRTFGKQFGDVTPGQLRALAIVALRSMAAPAPGPTTDGPSGARFSMASDRATPEAKSLFDKAKNAIHDFLTDRLTGANAPNLSVLGLVPVRPLFNELSKHLPSARHYIDTKTAMDSMRNSYAQQTDATLQRWFKHANKVKIEGGKPTFVNRGENNRLMDIMHESTIAGVDPSKPFVRLMTEGDKEALRKADPESHQYEIAAEKERKDKEREAKWNDLAPRFRSLSKEAQDIYAEVRDSYKNMVDESERLVLHNVKRAMEAVVTKAKRNRETELERIEDEGLTGAEQEEAVAYADKKHLTAQTRLRRNRVARLKWLREQKRTFHVSAILQRPPSCSYKFLLRS